MSIKLLLSAAVASAALIAAPAARANGDDYPDYDDDYYGDYDDDYYDDDYYADRVVVAPVPPDVITRTEIVRRDVFVDAPGYDGPCCGYGPVRRDPCYRGAGYYDPVYPAPRVYGPRAYGPRLYGPRVYGPRVYGPRRAYGPRFYGPRGYGRGYGPRRWRY
jgi:hypothetical protein